jgi:hypothetical protein
VGPSICWARTGVRVTWGSLVAWWVRRSLSKCLGILEDGRFMAILVLS